jgi:hypothetical protein
MRNATRRSAARPARPDPASFWTRRIEEEADRSGRAPALVPPPHWRAALDALNMPFPPTRPEPVIEPVGHRSFPARPSRRRGRAPAGRFSRLLGRSRETPHVPDPEQAP